MSSPPTESAPRFDQARWFTEEVHSHDSSLKAYLRGSFPQMRDVDDIVQESYLRILTAKTAVPIRSAKAFLFRIARNLALDGVRRNRASPLDCVPDLAALPVIHVGVNAPEAACSGEEAALLAEALANLPPRCREIIILRKFHFLSQKEVALRLGLSELTVQEQVYRGLRRCEKFLVQRGVIRPCRHD